MALCGIGLLKHSWDKGEGLFSRDVTRPHRTGVRKKYAWEESFQQCIKWRVGNGETTSFWMDSWLREEML